MILRHRRPVHLGRTVVILAAAVTIAAALLGVPIPAAAGPTGSFVNAARADAGLPALEEHGGLDGIAGDHARTMAARGSLYHLPNLDDAVGAVVPNWTRVGQNVGAGSSLSEVEGLMMASAQHRANILGDYTLMGSGAVTDGNGRVWVAQVFAKTSAAPPATTATTRAPPVTQAPTPTSTPAERPAAPARASRSVPRPAPVAPPSGATTFRPAALAVADRGIVGVASAPARTRPVWWDRWWPWHSRPGYWLAGADGGVFAYGRARYLQSLAGQALNAPVVGLAALRDGRGYWLATADGGVFAFGRAPFLSSLAGQSLRAPVRSVAAKPDGTGYWLASADGGVFAFGQAPYLGSLTGEVDTPVVAITSTPSGGGYWLVTAAGAVYAFGDAGYAGGLTGDDLAAPIVGIEATPSGRGYRLVAADGGVFAFGDASYEGSLAGQPLNAKVIALDATSSGRGYRLVSADGGVFAFGDASFAGSGAGRPLNAWRPLP